LKCEGLLSKEDCKAATGYTERPPCVGLVPLDYKTPKMKLEEMRSLLVPYDLEKEARQRRKELRQRGRNPKHGAPFQSSHSTPLSRKEASNGKPAGRISEITTHLLREDRAWSTCHTRLGYEPEMKLPSKHDIECEFVDNYDVPNFC
jgi:hypothetical protein